MTAPRVVAVVVTYEPEARTLAALLERLEEQCTAVVVVDNGSAIQPADACERVGAELIALPTNEGIAAAQNRGIARAIELAADHVLLSDQDSLPADDMVGRLLDGYARAAAAGRPVAGVGPVSSDSRTTSGEMVYVARRWGPRRAGPEDVRPDGLVEVAFLIASGCLIPAAALERVGTMNADWFIDHIDLEWGLRAGRAGDRLFAVAAARLSHQLGERVTKIPGRSQPVHVQSAPRTYYMARNTVLLLRSGLLRPAWRLGYLVWLAKYLAFNAVFVAPRWERIRLMAHGLGDGLRGVTGPRRG
ncbi:glycosyltransferase family 2 protein [Occultella glacieicola]|uniref:Glycosyltransferase family 2 protein n=1 Tax=Occultella glacieicola TaxID=2518684 RepID=A0ABY2E695_9MICO|nr:glycosyltransferase family 2 protein [Occultella glacieicola]TDE96108.1 glycosyltransferase family 2 protein [Occultella glacieicola]